MKTVIIALPGKNYSNRFLLNWSKLLTELSNIKYKIYIINEYSSFVTFSRMKTLGLDVRRGPNQKPFNNSIDYDVWVTIDSDIVFTIEQFIELVESTELYPVVSGIYKMENMINYATVLNWDTEYYIKNGTFEFLTDDLLKGLSDKFIEVAYTGMGFFACKRKVLDELKYPYFHRQLEEIKDRNGNIVMVEVCSEDVSFCKNITDNGYKILINKNLVLGHEKTLVI
jgi:hypothetical protein